MRIGGGGEQTLRLVARYAGATNRFAMEHQALAHEVEVLERHCEAEGREPAEIQKTIIGGSDPVTRAGPF